VDVEAGGPSVHEAAPLGLEPGPSPLAIEEDVPAPLAVEPDPPAPTAEAAPPSAPSASTPEVAVDASALASEVDALFAERCHECHGPGKRPKGGLRLSDWPAVLGRPADEALVVAGDPEQSPLFARLVLPEDHEDRMPPEGPLFTGEELALVQRWIEAGAPAPTSGAVPDAVRPAEPIGELSPEARAARARALSALSARGAHARRLSEASEAVEVDLSVALPPAGAADLQALAGLEPCLVELSLARLALVDADLAALASFGELRRLRLGETALGDAALTHLVPLAKLESLDLHGTRLTDAAVPDLARLASLRRLYLGATALSPAGLEALTTALPGCTIVR